MRWRFVDPNNLQEVSERNAILTKVDDWWRAFLADQATIARHFSQPLDFDVVEWMDRYLNMVHPKLMWEYGPAIHGPGDRLVITPESERHLRPLVQTMLERAPTIDGWEFYEYRLPEDLDTALGWIKARTQRDAADFKVRVSRGRHNRIDLDYTASSIPSPDDRDALRAAFVATETLLGEACLDHWIGGVAVAPIPRVGRIGRLLGRTEYVGQHYIGLDRLRETVQAIIGSIVDQLPQSPSCNWVDNATWTLFELKPDEAGECQEQRDLFVARSANKEMWEAAHSGNIFDSERFSRCDETFCYVKLDGSEGLDEEHFADKAEIEDALDAVLKPAKLGCTIGGGTGRRYSYIDLALTDVEQGIAAVRQRLRAGNVPKRSWIQFFDSDLAAEWVGIYDDTPPPPLALDA